MGNNVRTQADGVWVDGYEVPEADWTDLERKIFNSWNGTRGGSYVGAYGTDAYVFGGSGLKITGPTRLTKGGAIFGDAGMWVVRDGAWPSLADTHVARAREIFQPLRHFSSTTPWMWSRNHAFAGIGSVALAARATGGRTLELPEMYVPLRVHNGATLEKVEFVFRVAERRKYAPLAMPKFRVLRVPKDSLTTKPQPLKETADGLGFASPPLVTSPATWYADGAVQSFVYECDQNNVIDITEYTYVLHIVEELGAQSADDEFDGIRFVERKPDVVAVVKNTDATSFAGGSIQSDGMNVLSGRALVVDPDFAAQTFESARNGLWIANAGGVGHWIRTKDLDEVLDWTPGWIVRVLAGRTNGGSTWQCHFPTATQRMNITADPAAIGSAATGTEYTWPSIIPAIPRGNIYHAVIPTFDVSDLRFQ